MEPTQVGRSRSQLRYLGHQEPELPKKVAAPQRCWQVRPSPISFCCCGQGRPGHLPEGAALQHDRADQRGLCRLCQSVHQPGGAGQVHTQARGTPAQAPGKWCFNAHPRLT